MNCKPGDLVVYVGLYTPSLGKTATVLRSVARAQPCWLLDRAITCIDLSNGQVRPLDVIADQALRPIRDNDGTDETLTWAGLPTKQNKQVTA